MSEYSPPVASAEVSLAFPILAALVVVAAAWLVRRARLGVGRSVSDANRAALLTLAALVAWSVLFLGLAHAGVLARFDLRPPPPLLMGGAILVTAGVVSRSALAAELARGLSSTALIGLQIFRLPLELAMHRAATEGVMPVQMSFGGANFDIVTGVAALAVLLVYRRREPPRAVVWAFAFLGTGLLAIILGIALASTPMFRAFGTDPSVVNTFVFYPPFVLLPAVLVFVALVGQLVLFRRLWFLRQTTRGAPAILSHDRHGTR